MLLEFVAVGWGSAFSCRRKVYWYLYLSFFWISSTVWLLWGGLITLYDWLHSTGWWFFLFRFQSADISSCGSSGKDLRRLTAPSRCRWYFSCLLSSHKGNMLIWVISLLWDAVNWENGSILLNPSIQACYVMMFSLEICKHASFASSW